MSSNAVWLATASSDVKLWDATQLSLGSQFCPHSGNVTSLCWSHDNSYLATASSAGDSISLNYINANNHCVQLTGSSGISCVSLSNESQFLAGAGTSGSVVVWDVKSGRAKKTFDKPCHKGVVTSVEFGFRDTSIASGSECGDVILYNTATGQGFSPLQTPSKQAIRQLHFSRFRRALLGAASDDGCLYLWDTNTKTLSHRFDAESGGHRAPCTDLVFSPCNQMLLISVGLDKSVICYDVTANKVIKNMSNEEPLTSVDLQDNGFTLAVGTSRGRVWLYDLRTTSVPIGCITAHDSVVNRVSFQSAGSGSKKASSKSGSTPAGRSRDVSTQNANNNNNNVKPTATQQQQQSTTTTTGPTNEQMSLADSSGAKSRSDVSNIPTSFHGLISPARDDCSPVSLSKPLSESLAVPSSNRLQPVGRAATAPCNGLGDDSFSGSIFSPLNDGTSALDVAASELNRMSFSTFPSSQPSAAESSGGVSVLKKTNSADVSSTAASVDFTKMAASRGDAAAGSRLVDPPSVRTADSLQSRDNSNGYSDESRTLTGSPSVTDRCPVRVAVENLSAESTFYQPSSGRSATARKPTTLSSLGPLPAGFLGSSHPAALRHASDSAVLASGASSRRGIDDGQVSLQPVGIRNTFTPPDAMPSGGSEAAAAINRDMAAWGAAGDTTTATATLPPYLVELVRNTVREEVEESAEKMRRYMMQFHADMLKQFYTLQVQTRDMLHEYSINPDLVAEIERLRVENERLRKNF